MAVLKRTDLIYPELSYKLVGLLYEVWKVSAALKEGGLQFKEQKPAKLTYKDTGIGIYYMDFLIEDKIILEIKRKEYFSKNQKGSSAMPHKRNPILSENLTGLARMIRSYVVPALENIALWHERDISHSSVERNIGPDANITLDFALHRLANILNNMVVYPKKMLSNLNITKGLIFSEEVMLELTKSGIPREKAYRIVQKHAKQSFSRNIDLIELIKKDKLINSKISISKMKNIFNYSKHFKYVNYIFRRVF